MSVVQTVEPLLLPVVEAQGVELYDIEFIKEGGNRVLRLYIDKETGVDLDDCERVSHAVDAALDEHDPINTAYVLEISSPGIERKLKKERHFKKHIGHKVTIKLFAPLSPEEKRKNFTGILTGYDKDMISITDEEENHWQFENKKVSMCRLVVF